jgi:RNA-directed DNA polymerase
LAVFFDSVSKEWLVRFVEHRIGDKRIICEGGEVRFLSATRLVVGFKYESDARRFWDALRARLEEFALALHPDKTRLIEFGRSARDRRASAGLGKSETFKFLRFAFICGKSRRGQFIVHRKSRRDRMQAKLKEVKKELRKRMHQPIAEQGRWLAQVVRGYFAYQAVPMNRASISDAT